MKSILLKFVIIMFGSIIITGCKKESLGTVSNIECSTVSSIGTLIQGVEASGVSINLIYLGGDGGKYLGIVENSTIVNGLKATLPPGSYNKGSGTLNFIISGTPSSSGVARFILQVGSSQCIVNINVEAVNGTITDLDCDNAINSGILTQGATSTGVKSTVSYTGGNGGVHNGQMISSTGVTGLAANLPSGTFSNGSGILTYTISGTPVGNGTAFFEINIGGKSCTLTRSVQLGEGSINALNCGSATNTGTIKQGISASGVTSSVPYTGGTGGTHSGQIVSSTGVTGLTATLPVGVFSNSGGTLTYTITGTPVGNGTASFSLNIGGVTCTLIRNVEVGVGSISALNCNAIINNGSLTQGIPANGVSSSVPYAGGNSGAYNEQSVSSTGVTGLTATLLSGTFANGSGTLSYTISGTPASSGTASFDININGKTCTINRPIFSEFIDSRDGITYKTVVIGTQTWMAENLNYITGNSWCYDNSTTNCSTYGRLYDWNTALTACPAGWHLPSSAEWNTLSNYLGDFISQVGGKMKSVIGWSSPNTGATNQSGFTGLPGGIRSSSNGFFIDNNTKGYWWSSTEQISIGNSNAFIRRLDYSNSNINSTNTNKQNGVSCRCIKD